jgi:hypothetical protein
MDEGLGPRSRVGARFKRRWLPLLLTAIGLWGLAGCLYLPTPERPADRDEKDYRGLLGDAKSRKAIRPGLATKASVIALLGQPQYVSADGRDIAYEYEVAGGILVYPLCFEATAAQGRMYGVRLHFDDDGVLVDWTTARANRNFAIYPWFRSMLRGDAVRLLNEHGPKLIPATQP